MGTEGVDDGCAAATREINFDLDGETFARDQDGGIMSVLFQNTERTKIFVFVQTIAFGEAVFVESVVDFAGWSGGADQNGDDANYDQGDKSPPLHENRKSNQGGADDEQSDVPTDVVLVLDVFFGVPRDCWKGFCHKSIITQNVAVGKFQRVQEMAECDRIERTEGYPSG